MNFKNILFEKNGEILTITINRPDKLNALNKETLMELGTAFEKIEANNSIKGVIITGSGDKAFVAGADILEISSLDNISGTEFALEGQEVFNKIEQCSKPVVAAINGFALGGGCELAMACHVRIANGDAKFGQPEVNLGVIPGFGGTQRLPRIIGKGRALELLMTGNMIDAQEAYRIGLVNQVTSKENLLDSAINILNKMAEKGPYAIEMIITAVNNGLDKNLSTALSEEANLFGQTCATEDKQEGISAFLEKRKPNFSGK
ncbi:enoyl-CoA hydratase-related protein [Calditrichota bacterium]